MKAIGMKIITRERVVAMTAMEISLVAWTAACIGGTSFSSMKRYIFSRTIMASSITIPTARVRPSRVIEFSVKSIARIKVNVVMIEVGMAMELISTVRQSRM